MSYPHLLQRLCQHIATLLLVDEDDDRRLEATRKNLQKLLSINTEKKTNEEEFPTYSCIFLMSLGQGML